MGKMKLNTYNGIEISVTTEGQFCAEVLGVPIYSDTMERLEKTIELELKAAVKSMKLELPCYGLVNNRESGQTDDGAIFSLVELTLVGLNRTDSSFKWLEPVDGKVVYALPKTAENLAIMREMVAAMNTQNRLEDVISERKLKQAYYGGRIKATEYDAVLIALKEKYAAALAASEAK